MARRATRGSNAQFTYDFGIAIAQSTVNKVARLTGVTLSLASAFYALKSTAEEYVETLKENTARFGGAIATMKAMQQAQDNLITGMSRFDVRDQMAGMNELLSAGVDLKKNLDFIEKAAHATGNNMERFSFLISNAVRGNLRGLVDAGIMTQEATKAFDKFRGNTKAMQEAVIEYLRKHKGLMTAIKEDFNTVEDGVKRLRAIMTSFIQSFIGKPNDPNGLYGSIARTLDMIADKFGKGGVLTQNMIMLRQYAEGVGVIMGWVVRQVGGMIVWLGRQAKRVTNYLLGSSDTFAERMRSFVVWLEFWKLKVVDVLDSITGAISRFYNNNKALVDAVLKVFWAYLTWGVAWKVITKGTLLIQGMIFGLRALRKSIIATEGVWAFFSKSMSVGMFKSARNRSFFRMFGLTPYKVNARFRGLGDNAALFFSKGFSAVKKFMLKTWTGTLSIMRTTWVTSTKFMVSSFKYLWGGIIKGVTKWAKFSWLLWNRPMGAVKMLGNGMKWLMGISGKLIMLLVNGFRNVGNVIMNLPKIAGAACSTMRSMFMALNTTNPVGWIILAVAALALLYTKCKSFRVFVNNMFKMEWEWLKFLWNLVYGAIVYIISAIKTIWEFLRDYIIMPVVNFIKSAWRFLTTYIFKPVFNFFKNALGWIKRMWKAFMNTAVGRFINDYIIQPLKKLFQWIIDAWSWLVKSMGKVLSWISTANTKMSEKINAQAKALGMPELAASGGTYDTNDDTNYLAEGLEALGDMLPSFGGGGGGNVGGGVSSSPANPLISEPSGAAGGGTTNNISLSNGAVQIFVPKEVAIDENKLARLVRDEIRNLDRENNMRGGDI